MKCQLSYTNCACMKFYVSAIKIVHISLSVRYVENVTFLWLFHRIIDRICCRINVDYPTQILIFAVKIGHISSSVQYVENITFLLQTHQIFHIL